MRVCRIPGGWARGLVLAVVCALVIPGGGAVGFHSSGGGRFVKHIVAPYANAYSNGFENCAVTNRCTVNSSADKTNGRMTVSGSVQPNLPVSLGGAVDSYATVVAEDELHREARRRGYTITFHIDRADFDHSQGYAYAYVDIVARHSSCDCNSFGFAPIYPWREGRDAVAYLDFGSIAAGTISISATLFGYAEQTELLTPNFRGPSFDVEVTLTEIDVFR